ncbi:GNAT family N-acetyltransferase [Leptolyngbya sp. FACHB-261]|uniref:GNAT family N-acetyltransferase n=1 Tax=Leptolyngbya sp. FACHB-261 TaxID=2692806 RepID=UPI0016855B78|nr:GNAT family N-acetyltransferase [Leptolyngbya sp. FACHB-261]MBD2100413.1 GNAT family N-acetyltransferase [Leptolyngbya sp. FACHB-261]
MTIVIKSLGRNDADILQNVDPDVFDDPIDLSRADEFLADPRHHLVVALATDRVIGFVSAVHYVHPDKPHPELWINEVGVAETYRRQGLGKRLLQSMFDVARELGCAEAWVLTDRENTAAMNLYSAVANAEAPSDHVMFTFNLGVSQ